MEIKNRDIFETSILTQYHIYSMHFEWNFPTSLYILKRKIRIENEKLFAEAFKREYLTNFPLFIQQQHKLDTERRVQLKVKNLDFFTAYL